MALILNIDTSTTVCSANLAKEGTVISLRENNDGLNHSLLLGLYVKELLEEQQIEAKQLDAVSVSMGPGSYTGLRIGVSLAKGLCFGSALPLIAVNTLQALAASVSERLQEEALYCPMIDARRMEVYTALFDRENRTQQETGAQILGPDSFAEQLRTHKIYFFGNGSDKFRSVITSPNARFLPDIQTSSANMVRLSEERYRTKKFEDVAYFEPFYLKEFLTTTPKSSK
ncbi:MAG: tRNA (adenosine(37)-N6)-threonylcarbamoyltransferase complex dimerization subunit type 1 TsaB [Culturomica sp.]|jgi:tRNA threonylcarbamoyladenosine biosynthesis protein TsaB|nr:tRNA (adenosine(37)-N6)-threonylcarbamoyltransferase complex dimerization subunit type 1 TsaB [Culturomica sp.]